MKAYITGFPGFHGICRAFGHASEVINISEKGIINLFLATKIMSGSSGKEEENKFDCMHCRC